MNIASISGYKTYPYISKYNKNLSFRGKLENDFFEASRNNDTKSQLKALSSIKFDITCKEEDTGNNFLHIALINGEDSVIKKALNLLRNKKKEDRFIAIMQKNSEGHEPTFYTEDEGLKQRLRNLIGMDLPITPKEVPQQNTGLNELKEGEEIKPAEDTISFFDDIDSPSNDKINEVIQDDKIIPSNEILSDVIGHNDVKEQLNTLIIQPYKTNQFIPFNGFLLYGASGIGKTHLVKSLFKELNEEYRLVSSLADFEKYLESAEERFKKTKRQTPIFIDNIDVLLPKMEQWRGDNVKTSRLMHLIESSASKGLILIGVTDKKFSIEPNAIAPNRFDKHIELSPLMEDDRKNLIKYYTKKLDLPEEIIEKIQKDTVLLSPAAIEVILKEVQFIKKNPQYEDFKNAVIKYAKDKKLDISQRGKTAVYDTFIQREAIREYDPKSLDEVKGMDYAKNTLYNTVIASFSPERQKEYKENRISLPNGILLYGPPGCGKTYIVKAIAAQANLPLYQIKMSEFGSKYVGETSNRLKQVFDQLRTKFKNTGEASLLFFDECDSFFRKVGENEQWRTDDVNTLKEEMNNAGRDGIIIVAATNEITQLNDALVRDGRFDDKIFIDFPDKDARFGLIEASLENRVKTQNILKDLKAIQELADMTDGIPSAGITTVINKVVKNAVDKKQKEVTFEDLKKAFEDKIKETSKMQKGGEIVA